MSCSSRRLTGLTASKTCAPDDGGTLGDGELDGYCLVRPRHGAKFDVRNGHVVCMPATENTPSHEVRIDGDQVLVRLSD
jgi:3-phenylpropionate/trans-cinnamate dioxygenase ferredoxin subunit